LKNPITKKGWWSGSRCRSCIQTPVPQKKKKIQAWWYTLIIPTLRKLRQEDYEFKANVSLKPCLKEKKSYL
jgi:hypothetical protein